MREKIPDSIFWLGVSLAWTFVGLLGCAVLALFGAPLLLAAAALTFVFFAFSETRRALTGGLPLDALPSPSASRETSAAVKSLALPSAHERVNP